MGAALVLGGSTFLGHLLPGGGRQARGTPTTSRSASGSSRSSPSARASWEPLPALQTALPEEGGWTLQPVLVVAAGLGLTSACGGGLLRCGLGRALAARPSVAGVFHCPAPGDPGRHRRRGRRSARGRRRTGPPRRRPPRTRRAVRGGCRCWCST
ncbi:hypothetical protein QJS66_11775 [Kocuria rhizophila]|nr:hypothetical protein QJS66_11775 [Kocuria rhizophila]